jgi:hypothetical protein
MVIFRKSDKKIDAAKAELAAVRVKLDVILSREVASLHDSAAFAIWNEERTAVATEEDRLERLIAALTEGGEAQAKFEAEEALRKRAETAREHNAALSERIRTEGAQLAATMKALARDVAASQVETAAINRALPAGTPPLQDANNLARGRPAVPRQDISEKLIDLWCRATDGGLIGDQDAVVPIDTETGHLFINRTRLDCVKRTFRSVQYSPEVWLEIPEDFHSTLRIPHFDRQGVDFDGQFMVEQAVAAMNIEPKAEKKTRRPVQTELIPVEPWTPPVLKPVGSS